MDAEKMTRQLTMIRELVNTIQELKDQYDVLKQGNNLATGDEEIMDEAETWLNQIAGTVGGYEHEFRTYIKYRVGKSREVVRGFYADITITDPITKIGKAVQLKSTNQDDASAVTSMISDAANQLSNERGERPRNLDRRVIDMQIRSDKNPWPFTNKNTHGRGTKSELEFKQKAIQVVLEAVTNYRQHSTGQNGTPAQVGTGMSPKARGHLTDVQNLHVFPMAGNQSVGPRSGIKAFQGLTTMGGMANFHVVNLTVKIRFSPAYWVIDRPQGTREYIDEIKLQFDRAGLGLICTDYYAKKIII